MTVFDQSLSEFSELRHFHKNLKEVTLRVLKGPVSGSCHRDIILKEITEPGAPWLLSPPAPASLCPRRYFQPRSPPARPLSCSKLLLRFCRRLVGTLLLSLPHFSPYFTEAGWSLKMKISHHRFPSLYFSRAAHCACREGEAGRFTESARKGPCPPFQTDLHCYHGGPLGLLSHEPPFSS